MLVRTLCPKQVMRFSVVNATLQVRRTRFLLDEINWLTSSLGQPVGIQITIIRTVDYRISFQMIYKNTRYSAQSSRFRSNKRYLWHVYDAKSLFYFARVFL